MEFKAFYLLRDVVVWRARQWRECYSDSLIVGGSGARVAQRPRVLLSARYGARAMCDWGKLFRVAHAHLRSVAYQVVHQNLETWLARRSVDWCGSGTGVVW